MDKSKVSDAKRRANNVWDHKNMSTLGCKIRKKDADAFKEYASNQGKTANAVLKEYVYKCINKKPEN